MTKENNETVLERMNNGPEEYLTNVLYTTFVPGSYFEFLRASKNAGTLEKYSHYSFALVGEVLRLGIYYAFSTVGFVGIAGIASFLGVGLVSKALAKNLEIKRKTLEGML